MRRVSILGACASPWLMKLSLDDVLIFIACSGVPCCQHQHDQLGGIVSGEGE